jgi:MFS-type transporter involved in bile tolerance (Atg22 family)
LAVMAVTTGSSRNGILALIILFVIGYWMLVKVEKLDKAEKAVQ